MRKLNLFRKPILIALLMFIYSNALAQGKTGNQSLKEPVTIQVQGGKYTKEAERMAYYKLLESYEGALQELKGLRRQIRLLKKKEAFNDKIENAKKQVAEGMLHHLPPPDLGIKGVVGNCVLVGNYAVPLEVKTPYGPLELKGNTISLNGKLVFPYMKANYDETLGIINGKLPKYYQGINPSFSNGFSGAIPISAPSPSP